MGSLLAFANTTGVLDLHYGKFAYILYDRLRKRTLRKNMTAEKSLTQPNASKNIGNTERKLRRSA